MNENETIVEQESMSPEEVLVKMKETMVPKEEANKWQKKYNDLFQSVANGSFSGEDKPAPKTEAELKADYEANLKALADTTKSMRPLEMFQRMLDVDDYCINHGERSAFAPSTGEYSQDIMNSCEKIHSLLESVIAQSDNCDDVALAYLGNHLADPAGINAIRRAR